MSSPRNRTPHARLGLTSKASAEDAKRARDEVVSYLESAPEDVRRWARDEIAAADEAYAAISSPAGARKTAGNLRLRRAVAGVVTVAAAVAVVVGVYDMGGGKGESASRSASASAGPALSPADQARLSKLMRKLKANPDDVKTLVAIGNVFFDARDFNGAGSFMQRALTVEPENVDARLALGTAEYNLNLASDARRDFQRVIAADPENVVAYLNLGFLYASEDPPDVVQTRKMWDKVIELAPGSDLAKTVSTHLKGLEKAEAASGAETSAGSEG